MAETAESGKAEEKSEQKTEVLFEDVLERCCGTGRWQTLLIGYMSVMWLLFPVFSMSMMFVGATPKFRCADGFAANATFASLPSDTPRCHAANSTAACQRWAFDPSVYVSTVVTEWTLVCGRKPLLSLLQSWLMIGGLFAAVRFLTGVAMSAMISSQYVLMLELCSSERRAAIGIVSIMPFAFGTCFVALGSYLIRTRWLLQLAYAVPCLIFLFNFWLMPESPRWLVLQGRFPEACAVLRRGARWNGRRELPEEEVLQLMAEARNDMLSRQTTMKTAAAMLLTFVQKDTTFWLVLGVVAKIGVSSAYNTIMVFTAELMPTEVRSLACGLRQLAARVGAALSPFVVDLTVD
ncbi:solute carrier family 22 member 16-like [Pollicipes pollicipes]|uniref:solute carrier family 22 member 16-like n=1 Tax=Pollicipes pollicipes TaxID=41117 RepID=UPI00188559EF|nr:solute carrier family 22 member 16-like [Pollicipes pollicipes]